MPNHRLNQAKNVYFYFIMQTARTKGSLKRSNYFAISDLERFEAFQS